MPASGPDPTVGQDTPWRKVLGRDEQASVLGAGGGEDGGGGTQGTRSPPSWQVQGTLSRVGTHEELRAAL